MEQDEELINLLKQREAITSKIEELKKSRIKEWFSDPPNKENGPILLQEEK